MLTSASDTEHANAKLNKLQFIAEGAEEAMLLFERHSMSSWTHQRHSKHSEGMPYTVYRMPFEVASPRSWKALVQDSSQEALR